MLFSFKPIYPTAFLIAALLSCETKHSNSVLINEINAGLVQATAVINWQAENTFEQFRMKLSDPATKLKAEYWHPKLMRVYDASGNLSNLAVITDQIKSETSLGTTDTNKSGKKSINQILINNDQYRDVYKRLKQFKDTIFRDTPGLVERVGSYSLIPKKRQDTIDTEEFLKNCLMNATPNEALCFFSRLENNLAIVRLQCIQYFNEQVAQPHFFKTYEAIVAQNAKILKAGDELEITGGVGSFSKQRLLAFSVQGKIIEPNERGLAIYKFRTPKDPGNYLLPVSVRLLDEDSIVQNATFTVEYSVVEGLRKH
jgi:hypothetical protein